MFPNLKAEMTRKEICIKDISEILGVSEKTAKNYLNGRTKISWFDVLKVQGELFPDLKVSYLFDINKDTKHMKN